MIAQKRITEEDVCDAFAEFLAANPQRPRDDTPNEDEVRELTHWINLYRERPWNAVSVGDYRRADSVVRDERKALNKAAAILQRDLAEYEKLPLSPRLAAHISDVRAALRALTRARGPFENGAPRVAEKGRDPTPWAFMARKLAAEALIAQRRAQKRQGLRVQETFGSENGAVILMVEWSLQQITSEKLPKRATILDAIK